MTTTIISSNTESLFNFRMDMMREFIARGHRVIALGDEQTLVWSDRFAEQGITYLQIPVARTGLNPVKDLKTLLAIRKILKRERVDKIFTYHAKTIVYGALAARSCGITEVYPMVAGLGSILRGNGLKMNVIRTVMSSLYGAAFSSSKRVFFQNHDDLNELTQAGLLTKDRAVIVNGSGVNLTNFTPSPIPSHPAFLYIGRLIRDKGVWEYLQACREVKRHYPQLRCMLVGPFDINPSALQPKDLQPFIDDKVIDYIGGVEDVRPYLDACTTYILPSYHEGTPKSVLEAMAKGRAIITTDAPGCRETVTDGVNGYLVPTQDVKSLVNKMVELLKNPELNIKMGEESLKIARQKYDVRVVNRTIIETMNL